MIETVKVVKKGVRFVMEHLPRHFLFDLRHDNVQRHKKNEIIMIFS